MNGQLNSFFIVFPNNLYCSLISLAICNTYITLNAKSTSFLSGLLFYWPNFLSFPKYCSSITNRGFDALNNRWFQLQYTKAYLVEGFILYLNRFHTFESIYLLCTSPKSHSHLFNSCLINCSLSLQHWWDYASWLFSLLYHYQFSSSFFWTHWQRRLGKLSEYLYSSNIDWLDIPLAQVFGHFDRNGG